MALEDLTFDVGVFSDLVAEDDLDLLLLEDLQDFDDFELKHFEGENEYTE